jgi:N-acetylglucosaminyldiphosphoundecaprenol N-acetyl-beta-D-mannosaminyltransferase
MARWTGQFLPQRVTGVDTVTALLNDLGPEHPVFLLGGAPGIAERAAAELTKRNPRLVITGTDGGSSAENDASRIITKINAAKPHLLLVAFGAPAQDLWIDHHLKDMPSVRVAMGIGGTLDFIAGTQKRAPHCMQSVGLEWLWRFVRQPSRWMRIVNAVIVFPWLVLRHGKDAPGA